MSTTWSVVLLVAGLAGFGVAAWLGWKAGSK